MNVEKKRSETKIRIKTAFISLLSKKTIEKISIKEITDLASLNRGTFYIYYQDIYALLDVIECELFEEIEWRIQYILPQLLKGELTAHKLPDLKIEFLHENRETLKIFLGQENSQLSLRVKQFAKEELRKIIGISATKENAQMEYVLEYIICGQYGLIVYWLNQNLALPASDFLKLIVDINGGGAIQELKKILVPSLQASLDLRS